MTQQAAAAQELGERGQIATVANDPGNVAQAEIQHVLLPHAEASGRIMQRRDVDDALSYVACKIAFLTYLGTSTAVR